LVQAPTVSVYVIRWSPPPAEPGSNTPLTASVIPVPDQTPPAVTEVKLTDASS